MDDRTIKAIAEMIRVAARLHGVELVDVEFTICRSEAEQLEDFEKEDL